MIELAAFLSLAALCAPSVHPSTSVDVARTESGFQPLAIGIVGGTSIYPKTLTDAVAQTERLEREGKNYSVGIMQINRTNFRPYKVTAEDLFTPCKNLSVYEKIITDCYLRGGDLTRALSCYYSGDFSTGTKKEKEFADTSYTERIGYKPTQYVVPGTKEEKPEKDNISNSKPDNSQVVILYPSRIIRGDIQIMDNQVNQ